MTVGEEVRQHEGKIDQKRQTYCEYEILRANRYRYQFYKIGRYKHHYGHCKRQRNSHAHERNSRLIRRAVVFKDQVFHQNRRLLERANYEPNHSPFKQYADESGNQQYYVVECQSDVDAVYYICKENMRGVTYCQRGKYQIEYFENNRFFVRHLVVHFRRPIEILQKIL